MARKKTKKKLQVRRCTICQKIGHNRSTCSNKKQTEKAVESIKKSDYKKPLKFYVHHVTDKPKKSNNIVDLKKHNIWNEISTYSPSSNLNIYQNYHSILSKKDRCTSNISNFDNRKVKNFLPETNDKQHLPGFRLKKVKTKAIFAKLNLKPNIKFDIKKIGNSILNNLQNKTINTTSKTLYHLHQWQKIYFPLKRTLISLIIFSVIIFAPNHAKSYYQTLVISEQKIKDNGAEAYTTLENSTSKFLQGNITEAQSDLSIALSGLNSISQQLENEHPILQSVASYLPIFGNKVKSSKTLLSSGKNIAQGNKIIFSTIANIQSSNSSTLTDNIKLAKKDLSKALPIYNKGLDQLNSVNIQTLPVQYQMKFSQFKKIYSSFVNDLNNLYASADAIEMILGSQGSRRYLLVFQNENEIRPTGGFIGSYALLEVKDGQIINLDIPAGGSYDTQGLLEKNIEPPAPLLMINNRWHFRDANWFADFPTSAEKLMWFYRHSKHITTDGVIAINSSVLERLLNITGPIKDNKRAITLSSTNAINTIQKIAEEGPEKTQLKPKKIIREIAEKFISEFSQIDTHKTIALLNNFQDALMKKEIQMYFIDDKPKKTMEQYGWDGKMTKLKNNQDYLMVVNTNINGHKSDAKIKQEINHQSVIQIDGSIINTVTIKRTHTGKAGEEFYGYPNTNYLRLYVPQGSQLLKSGGFTLLDENFFRAPNKYAKPDKYLSEKITKIGFDPLTGTKIANESNKTSFGNWIVTEPGKTTIVYFTYKLPFKINEQNNTEKKWLNLFSNKFTNGKYQLIVQKQSGIESDLSSTIIFPKQWNPVWGDGQQIKLANNGAVIDKVKLNSDMVWSLIMKK